MLFPYYKRATQLLVLGLLILGTACTKWVSVPPPVNQVTAEGAFANDQTADATVAGLYSRIMESNLYFLNGGMTLFPGLSADELYKTSPNSIIDAFTQNALTSTNDIVSNSLWGKAYAYIYQANACLEGLLPAPAVSKSVKEKLQGEVLFMRALSYFYLVNAFGNVPLALTTDYAKNAKLPRAPEEDIYNQILANLTEAKSLLSSFPSETGANRPNEMTASALLARAYLWKGNWPAAAAMAGAVIESGLYRMEAPGVVFLTTSQETIFQLSPVVGGVNTAEGLTFLPYSTDVIPSYALTDLLVAAFEPGDTRKAMWTDSNIVNGRAWYYPAKYKVRNSNEIVESNIVLRLADMYLIRAEAEAEQGMTDEAIADVNIIRARAGLMPLPTGLAEDSALAAIARENRIEFFAEWGHRWFDLKRRHEANAVLGGLKSDWQGTDTLYPIPYREILQNSALIQNAGY